MAPSALTALLQDHALPYGIFAVQPQRMGELAAVCKSHLTDATFKGTIWDGAIVSNGIPDNI